MNVLHTCITNPADLELLVDVWTKSSHKVHSIGWVPDHGYWVLFERVN